MNSDHEITKEVIGLLKEKKQLFEKFEAVTDQMMTDSFDQIDQMIDCTEQREQLKQQIDALDLRIRETAMQSKDGDQIIRVSKNLCDFKGLSPEYREIFEAGQDIFRIISRVQIADPQIQKNMEAMMEELQQRIRQNKKNTKFTGYIKNMGIQASKGALYDKKR